MSEDAELRRELDAARATLAAQALQIHQLQQEVQQSGGAGALSATIELGGIVGEIVGQAPYRALLDSIVQAARHIFGAGAASIALLDHATDELVFEAAAGGSEVVNLRFPAHQGIAGWVAMTGEAIAIGDVRSDPRFAKDFAQSTGYVPTSILAVPLLVGDEVEGVLEVLDKPHGATFGLDDMNTLALFARPAAIAVEQARLVSKTGELLVQELERQAATQGEPGLAQTARTVLDAHLTAADGTLELARLVHDVSQRGERARRLAIEILTALGRYTG